MKILNYLLLLGAILSFGQTEKGKVLFGSTTNVTLLFDSSKSVFNLQPEVSFFVANNFAVGFSVNYQRESRNIISSPFPFTFEESKMVTATNLMTPQLTYFFDLNEKLKLFAKLKAGLAFEGSRVDNVSTNEYGYTVGSFIGLSYFINKSVSFDFGLGYDHINYGEDYIRTNQISSNLGFSIFL